jgi:chaperonin cofactor prefoldin
MLALSNLFLNLNLYTALGLLVLMPQQPDGHAVPGLATQNQRAFALVVNSSIVTVEGEWKDSDSLREYAQQHGGSYIVFRENGRLLLLDRQDKVVVAADLHKPLESLAKQQAVLSTQQAQLAAQQEELADRMKNSSGSEGVAQVASEQGRVGAEQGKVGREQGRIGAVQGEAGKTFYQRVEAILCECVKTFTCKAV